MFSKSVFVVAALMVTMVAVRAGPLQSRSRTSSSPYELVSIIELEEPCVRQGGLCLRIEDCDPGNRVQLNAQLCPLQQHLGVGCCYT